MQFGFNGFFIYDTDKGEITDSVLIGGSAFVDDVSPDGQYLSVWFGGGADIETRIYDAVTHQVLHVLPSVAQTRFVDNGTLLLGNRGRVYYRYSTPGFSLISVDTLFATTPANFVNEGTRSIYAVINDYQVYQISYDSMKIIRQWAPVDENDIPIFIKHFAVHPNGRFLYVNGGTTEIGFLVYDLQEDRLISSFPMYTYWGDLGFCPSRNEVWVTDPGDIRVQFSLPEVGTVFIFDALTGDFEGGISLYGFVASNPRIPLDAKRVDFSPDGREAYVSTGAIGGRENPGTILRFETKTRKLVDVIFPDIDRFPNRVAIGPKP
jgi:hypothetical protein